MKYFIRSITTLALLALFVGQVPAPMATAETAGSGNIAQCADGKGFYTAIANGKEVEKACPSTYAEKTQLYPQQPWTIHEHAFYNNSLEDKDFLKKLYIRKFRVYLASDVAENTDINKVICTAPPVGSTACKGEQLTSQFGGAKVTLEKSDKNAYPYMITWEYGMANVANKDKNNESKAQYVQSLPNILGANPTLDAYFCEKSKQSPSDATFKDLCARPSAKYQNRGFNTFVPTSTKLLQMFSLDIKKPTWTATTHSQIEIAHLFYPQKTKDNASAWAPEGGAGKIAWKAMNPQTPWQWENIGTDKTIWSRTDYPTSGFCQTLNITPNTINPNQPTTFTVTPVTQGTGNAANLRYTWTATSGNFGGQNPLTNTSNQTVTFSGAPLGTTLTVTTSDIFGVQYPGCTKTLNITSKAPDCTLTPDAPECKKPSTDCTLTPNAPECKKPTIDCTATPNAPECKKPIDCKLQKGTPQQCPDNYIEKRVEGQKIINLSRTGSGFTKVKYQILYTPVYPSNKSYSEITDSLWGGKTIKGTKGGTVKLSQDASDAPQVIQLGATPTDTKKLNVCSGTNKDKWVAPCYQNQIKGSGKVIIYGAQKPVLITYWGKVSSTIDCKKIDPKNGCGEEFDNTAQYVSYQTAEKLPPKIEGKSTAKILVICPYILNRAGGDVLFESPLQTTLIDINQCSSIKSSDDVVITPKDKKKQLEKTGGAIPGFEATHKICEKSNLSNQYESKLKSGEDNPLKDYENPVDNISSLLCEFKTTLSSELQKATIEQSIQDSRLRVARWNTTSQQVFSGTIPAGQDVFRLPKGKSLKIGNIDNSSFGTKIRPVTFIVEDANIEITGNIDTTKDQFKSVFGKQATIALIALNGNIIIHNNTETVSAVLFAQKGENQKSGNIMGSGGESTNILTIIGSVYGDIEQIVAARKPLGKVLSLGKDQSAFTVRYDERIFFNTPPVLQDLVNISQKQVVR